MSDLEYIKKFNSIQITKVCKKLGIRGILSPTDILLTMIFFEIISVKIPKTNSQIYEWKNHFKPFKNFSII